MTRVAKLAHFEVLKYLKMNKKRVWCWIILIGIILLNIWYWVHFIYSQRFHIVLTNSNYPSIAHHNVICIWGKQDERYESLTCVIIIRCCMQPMYYRSWMFTIGTFLILYTSDWIMHVQRLWKRGFNLLFHNMNKIYDIGLYPFTTKVSTQYPIYLM